MEFGRRTIGNPWGFVTGILFVFVTWQSQANTVEVDWDTATYPNNFSTSQITINAGDEVDIVNYDSVFNLQVTGAAPESFSANLPPTDGVNVYYVPHVYNNPGTFSFSDSYSYTVTVTVNSVVTTPLSVTITAPANNATFAAPATFSITAAPSGGAMPYAEVDFYVGTNLAGIATSSPFTATVTNLPVGNYNISAVVIDNSLNTATNSILVSVGQLVATNYILSVDCADIYSSGSVDRGLYLDAGSIHGGLEFAAFNASADTSVLLEVNPYALPLFATNVNVYGFDGGTGTLMSSNYNSGTLIGVWALPPGLGYGQVATFDVTAFVKSTKGPYFGLILTATNGSDVFSSPSKNYGTPPELYVIGPPPTPQFTTALAGGQMIVSWLTNYSAGLSLQTSATLGPGASWTPLVPVLVGNQWVMSNSISGPSQFFRLSSH